MSERVKFYIKSSGRSPIEEFLQETSDGLRANFFDALVCLEQGQKLSLPLSRNLASIHMGLHELRLKDRMGIYRFFYFIKKPNGIYFLHAFKKKTQTLPQKEIEIILKRIKEV